MGMHDPRIDAYIAKSADFARPILTHLREVVHEACPDVEETMKWSSPSFMYHGIMAGMASFKNHAVFGFWKGSLVLDDKNDKAQSGMGQFGRLTKVSDLPSRKVLTSLVKKAMKLNESGIKAERTPKHEARKAIAMHPAFKAALARNKK